MDTFSSILLGFLIGILSTLTGVAIFVADIGGKRAKRKAKELHESRIKELKEAFGDRIFKYMSLDELRDMNVFFGSTIASANVTVTEVGKKDANYNLKFRIDKTSHGWSLEVRRTDNGARESYELFSDIHELYEQMYKLLKCVAKQDPPVIEVEKKDKT